MENLVIGIALKWVVSSMASSAAATDWNAVKAKVQAAIAAAVHSAWLDSELTKVADDVIDAVAKMAQDQTDVLAAVQALAGKNFPAAEAALKTLIMPYLGGDLAALLSAA